MVHSDLRLIDGDGLHLGSSYLKHQRLDPSRTGLNDLVLTNVVTGCTVLMNRALCSKASIPVEALMHDWWLALVASATGAIGFMPKAFVLYRQHGGNVLGARGTVYTHVASSAAADGPRTDALFELWWFRHRGFSADSTCLSCLWCGPWLYLHFGAGGCCARSLTSERS